MLFQALSHCHFSSNEMRLLTFARMILLYRMEFVSITIIGTILSLIVLITFDLFSPLLSIP